MTKRSGIHTSGRAKFAVCDVVPRTLPPVLVLRSSTGRSDDHCLAAGQAVEFVITICAPVSLHGRLLIDDVVDREGLVSDHELNMVHVGYSVLFGVGHESGAEPSEGAEKEVKFHNVW